MLARRLKPVTTSDAKDFVYEATRSDISSTLTKTPMFASLIAFCCLCQTPSTQGPDGLMGAQELLRLINKTPVYNVDVNAFKRALNAYVLKCDSMSIHEAAVGWVALIDLGSKTLWMHMMSQVGGEAGSFSGAFGALPRPEAWPEIVQLVSKQPASRTKQLLLALFARLTGDDEELLRQCGDDPELSDAR